MTIELQLLVTLAIGIASMAIGAVLDHWRWTRRLGLQSPTSHVHPEAISHRWRIASREDTQGHPWAIYRCTDCGALETRELPS